jgi:hypothetical protein
MPEPSLTLRTAETSSAAEPSLDANDTYYFPAGTFDDSRGADAFRRAWYSRALAAMGEPSLSGKTTDAETYRLLWIRTWDPPVAIRFVPNPTAIVLHVVELDGEGGYDPGKVSRSDSKRLGRDESLAVLRALEAADIWNVPTNDTRLGLDGSQWVMEARRLDSYRVVDRWSPEEGPYRSFCELLIQKARVQLGPEGPNGLY